MSKFITRDEHRRMYESRLCYACGLVMEPSDGMLFRQLNILVHNGCAARVRKEVWSGRPIPDVLGAIRGEHGSPRKVETRDIDGFLDQCDLHPDAWTECEALWREYVRWSRGNSMRRADFGRKIMGRGLREGQNGQSVWGWYGVAIREAGRC